MNTYIIECWFRYGDNEKDFETVQFIAEDLESAYAQANAKIRNIFLLIPKN